MHPFEVGERDIEHVERGGGAGPSRVGAAGAFELRLFPGREDRFGALPIGQRAQRRVSESGKYIELREASAEELPFESDSFDTVVGTLVMCSVPHPQRALAEIKRVLKPGGEYRFYEHVRYESAFGAFWQDAVMPVWRWFAAGCHPNRDTVQAIRNAGFNVVELEKSKPLPPLPPMVFARPHVKGIAKSPD